MPRPATGTIETHGWKDGRTITYRLRVRAYGRRWRIDLGTNHEGWNEDRAQIELDRINQQIARGTWQPPTMDEPAELEPEIETLMFTASRWWQRRKPQLAESTRADYEWRLSHILTTLKDDVTSAIDVRRVDELRDALVARGLAARSVNMVLDVLAQILDDAVEYKLMDVNPARGRRRRMKVLKPARGFLEPDMVIDLLDAAGEWERQVPPHQRYGRRAVLALLCLAGPRITELVLSDRREFDLARGSYWIPEAKTDAGERTVDLTAFCGDALRAHAASKNLRPDGPMFPTSTGGRLNASNLRNRLLINEPADKDGLRYAVKAIGGERIRVVRGPSAVERANDKRAAEGKIPLPKKVTPHTLRRTYASLCFFAGRDPRYVMSQIGHADARLTLQVYAQCMERRRVDSELVWSLMRFGDEPETRMFGPTNDPTRSSMASPLAHRVGRKAPKPRRSGVSG